MWLSKLENVTGVLPLPSCHSWDIDEFVFRWESMLCRSFCQGNNQLIVEPSGALVCLNTDGTAGIGPTSNTEIFKGACPDAYSYNFDDATSQFHCGHGSDYEVTICPGGITSVVNESRVYLDQ